MVEKQRSGEVSSVELVSACLEQIGRHNVAGAELRAVIEVNPEALLIAEGLDRDARAGVWRGPLHGIPILVKDNLDTADMMQTTAGSVALEGHYAAKDATVVRKLREQGAVMIGKANLTEWANFISDHMPNGYSSRGGQTRNPYGPGTLDVGGSSAGSGAGVAAGFAVAAIGTETSGSILSPASSNSLVGIKPTVGLVSRTGIIPIAVSQDTAGPMTRTVADAAILLQAMVGEDPTDAATMATRHQAQFYPAYLRRGGLNGARIGLPTAYYQGMDEQNREVFLAAVEDLRRAGAVVIDCDIAESEAGRNIDVLVHEFKVALNRYLQTVEPWLSVRTLADVIRFNEAHAEVALKYGQAIFEMAEATSGRLEDGTYIRQRLNDLQWSRNEGIDAVMDAHQLDALAFPNNYGAAIAAKAGYPSITVPAGYTTSGMPLGLTLTGRAFSEGKLIHLAYDYEQGTMRRKPPQL